MDSISKQMILYFVIPFIVSWCLGYLFNKWHKRPIKIIMPSDKWLSINENPIPQNIDQYIATDGETVDWMYNIKYNEKGKPTLSYKKTEITAWMPLPAPPKE